MTVEYFTKLTFPDWSRWRLKTYEVDDSSRGTIYGCVLTGCQHLLGMPRVATWLDGVSDRSVASSSVHLSSLIYITLLSPLISTIFSQKSLSERSCQPCQSTPSSIRTRQLLNRQLPVTKCGEYLFSFFQVAFCAYISIRATHPSVLSDPSVLGFIINCRQCLVRQVTSQWFVMGRNTRRYTVRS